MITLVGLGNPGLEYAKTRHNVGFMVVDAIAQSRKLAWVAKPKMVAELAKDKEMLLIKPMGFMNTSGQPVRALLDFYALTDMNAVYVVHDDLDLAFGSIKVQYGKGPHGHNGLLSIQKHLGSSDFWYVRVGIDGRAGQRTIPSDAYVLSQFSADEKNALPSVIQSVTEMIFKNAKI